MPPVTTSQTGGTPHTKKFDHFANVASGLFASVVMNSILQPLDLIKIKLQQTTERQRFFQVVKSIYKNGGLFSFYRGTLLVFFAGGLISSSRMYMYKFFEHKSKEPGLLSSNSARTIVTATTIGIFTGLILSPVEHIRIRMNSPVFANEYSGSLDALIKMRRTYGLRKVMKGYSLTVLREFWYYIFFFNIYEKIKQTFTDMGHPTLGISIGGIVSGPISWFLSYPMDTLKTQLQADHLTNPKWTAKSYMQHLVRTRPVQRLRHGIFAVGGQQPAVLKHMGKESLMLRKPRR